jgi:ribosomal protein L11 methyltransferase
VTEVPDDWEDRWRAFHQPVRVGPLWVGPPWTAAPPGAEAVVIDPGRAFGTGAHPTTRLCLAWLLELPRGSLLDVGCGSGVVAIAAARLGYAPVAALDSDPAAVEATARNAQANGVLVDARVDDATREALPPADVAVANIALEVVAALAFDADAVVTSGYFEDAALQLDGYVHAARTTSERWAADLWRRPE